MEKKTAKIYFPAFNIFYDWVRFVGNAYLFLCYSSMFSTEIPVARYFHSSCNLDICYFFFLALSMCKNTRVSGLYMKRYNWKNWTPKENIFQIGTFTFYPPFWFHQTKGPEDGEKQGAFIYGKKDECSNSENWFRQRCETTNWKKFNFISLYSNLKHISVRDIMVEKYREK